MAVTKEQVETIKLYADLMGEVKLRISALNTMLGGTTNLPSPIIRETGFLQLRMLCELTALSCLVAHGDIMRTTKIKKEWNAYRIITALAQLHPAFYPRPVD